MTERRELSEGCRTEVRHRRPPVSIAAGAPARRGGHDAAGPRADTEPDRILTRPPPRDGCLQAIGREPGDDAGEPADKRRPDLAGWLWGAALGGACDADIEQRRRSARDATADSGLRRPERSPSGRDRLDPGRGVGRAERAGCTGLGIRGDGLRSRSRSEVADAQEGDDEPERDRGDDDGEPRPAAQRDAVGLAVARRGFRPDADRGAGDQPRRRPGADRAPPRAPGAARDPDAVAPLRAAFRPGPARARRPLADLDRRVHPGERRALRDRLGFRPRADHRDPGSWS